MHKLVRFLKPYWWMLLLNVALLFAQANADLALPDYLSRIVNVGIQQGGIEHAAPEALRAETLRRVQLWMTPDERAYISERYIPLDETALNYSELTARYPGAAETPVMVVNAQGRADQTELDAIMGKGMLANYFVQQLTADPERTAEMAERAGIKVPALPPGTDLYTVFERLPAEQADAMRAGLTKQFSAMDNKAIVQAAAPAVRAEYAALGANVDGMQMSYIIRAGALMLALTAAIMMAMLAVGFLSSMTSSGFARDLRRAVFERVSAFSAGELDNFSTASLITRTTNDVTQVQMLVMMFMRMIIYAPIMGVGGILRAISKAGSMWWLIAAAVGALITLVMVIFILAVPKFRIIQKLVDRLNLVSRESLSGMMVIRAFNRQESQAARFEIANRDLANIGLYVSRVMSAMGPVMMLIMNVLMVSILWVGAHEVQNSSLQVGDILAFTQYAMQIVFSFLMMSFMFIFVPRASVSGRRIAEVLETEPTIHEPATPVALAKPVRGELTFKDVAFRYAGGEEDALRGLNFTAHPGQITAIIGPTGSGKSTIVSLVPRLYDVTAGSITLDGVDLRDLDLHELRSQVGLIPQRSVLFSGNIESNLRFADESAAPEALREAIEVAQAAEFIDALPDGMSHEIAQGGSNVSGGQKQRLAIARALVGKPPVLIFDDSFSALDYRTDAALRQALSRYAEASTLIIVTQRIATIRHAPQIVVLDEGKMVGLGTHDELMANCKTYREIALSQLSEEELQ